MLLYNNKYLLTNRNNMYKIKTGDTNEKYNINNNCINFNNIKYYIV